MSSYITYPVETDSSAISQSMIQELMSLQPGWIPNESNLEVAILEAVATIASETQYVASLVPATIFRYAGLSLFNIPPIDGASATAQSTWTMRDSAGYTIPANTLVVYRTSGSTSLYFRTQSDVVVAPGQTTTATGEVVLVASEYGEDYNGLDPQTIQLVDSLAFVTDIESTTETSGGVDAETDDEYLNRLRTELHLLSPRPILAADFAALALNIAGVGRAIAIDNYNPADQTSNNERMVAVAIADSDGRSVTSPVKAAVQTYLDSLRETNFIVNVIDPSYTTLDITVDVHVLSGYDSDTVIDAVISAVQTYLSPANWSWSSIIRYNELIALISDVPGVDYVANLSQPGADVTLPGVAALVTAGSITVNPV